MNPAEPHRSQSPGCRSAALALLIGIAWPTDSGAVWTAIPGIRPVPDRSWHPGFYRQSPRIACDRNGSVYIALGDTLFKGGAEEAFRPLASAPPQDTLIRKLTVASGGGLLVWGKSFSLDRGQTWQGMIGRDLLPSSITVSEDGRVLAGGAYDGISMSVDSCRTWKPVHFGRTYGNITQIIALPGNWALAAPLSDSLLGSTDQGATWQNLRGGNGENSAIRAAMLAPDPDSLGATAWAVDPGRRVVMGSGWAPAIHRLHHEESGITVSTRNPALGFPDSTANALAATVAKGSGRRLWLGTWGQGIYTSDDSGTTWSPYNDGLRDRFVDALTVTPDGMILALTGDGLYADRADPAGLGRVRARERRADPALRSFDILVQRSGDRFRIFLPAVPAGRRLAGSGQLVEARLYDASGALERRSLHASLPIEFDSAPWPRGIYQAEFRWWTDKGMRTESVTLRR